MNFSLKLLAALSALLMMAACETPGTAGGATIGDGTVGVPGMRTHDDSGRVIRPGSQSDLENNVGDRVFYAYDSSVLSAEAQRTLERQAAWLKKYPDVDVVIEGHCDERGTREYNLALGERRANAAKNYLVSLGVPSSRVSTVSYGKERPAVLGSNESAWAQNRRAVTVVE